MTDDSTTPKIPTLSDRLASQKLILYIALAGVLFLLPTVFTGFKTDDLIQRYTLIGNHTLSQIGFPLTHAPATLTETLQHYFTFFDPAIEGHNLAQRAYGTVPWWLDLEMKLSLFRPVIAFTHWLDYQLWPNVPKNMHLHSLVWLGGWLLLAGILYRRFIGAEAAAGLAALMFMLDLSYTVPATWIANRNALVCGLFGLLTIYLHDRWRTARLWRWGALAQLALLLTLWSAEAGLGVTAYLFAYALCLESGSWRQRIGSLLPATIVVIFWRLLYVVLGFGAAHTDMYVDPGANPLRFLSALVMRGPILLFSQISSLDEFTTPMAASLQTYVWLGVLASLILLGLIFYPLLKRNRYARFFMLGALISLVPLPAYAAMLGRLLIFVSFGMMGFLGIFIAEAFQKNRKEEALEKSEKSDPSDPSEQGSAESRGSVEHATHAESGEGCHLPVEAAKSAYSLSILARFTAALMIFLHVILPAFLKGILFLLALGGFNGDFLTTGALAQEPLQQVFAQLGIDQESAEREIILVNPPSPFFFAYLPYYMAWYNENAEPDAQIAFPEQFRILATGLTPTEIERVDAHTLKVRPQGGYLIPPEKSSHWDPEEAPRIHLAHTLRLQGHDFRIPKLSPMKLGEEINLSGMRVEITQLTEDQRPAEATFHFEKSLDDPSLIWLFWGYGPEVYSLHPFDFKPLTLPEEGEIKRISGPFG